MSTPGATANASPPVAAEPALQDFGWALSTVLRAYLHAAGDAVRDLPGGTRGYQVLAVAAGETCRNQATIADRLAIDRTIMTYLIDDLEGDGLVTRRPDPADRRARQVVLTAKGRWTLNELSERISQVERQVLAALSDSEVQQMRGLLDRAAADADAGGHSTDACTAAAELTISAAEAIPRSR